jgi:hypothetical protein
MSSRWSARPRRRWWELGWTLVGTAALASVVLGFLGFRSALPDESSLDHLYRSLQLFVLEGGAVPGSIPPTLDIARLLAPAVAAYATLRAVLGVFGEQVRIARARHLVKDHVLVVGAGRVGSHLLVALRDAGKDVVGLEIDALAPGIASCRARGIPVAVGSGADPDVLRRVGIGRARYLVACCGADTLNLRVAAAAIAACRERSSGLTVLVRLEDLQLWRRLSDQVLETSAASGSPVRLEYFAIEMLAARMVLDAHPPFADDASEARLIVIGLEGIGDSLVLEAARRWASRKRPGGLELAVCGPNAEATVRKLLDRHPSLAPACKITSTPDLDLDLDDLAWPQPSAVYVCMADASAALATALRLPRSGRVVAPIVLVAEDEETQPSALLRFQPGATTITAFGVHTNVLTEALLEHGTNELIARAMHDEYVRAEQAHGVTVAQNSSLVPWSQLPESLRESNRRYADNLVSKLDAIGRVLAPAPDAPLDGELFTLRPDEIARLAELEHERWCRDLLRDGWKYGGTKDPERKLHPLLVDWAQLSELDRDKDRRAVAELPRILARAGFTAVERRGSQRTAAEPAEDGSEVTGSPPGRVA